MIRSSSVITCWVYIASTIGRLLGGDAIAAHGIVLKVMARRSRARTRRVELLARVGWSRALSRLPREHGALCVAPGLRALGGACNIAALRRRCG